jgi:hypothetical protein
VAAAAVTAWLTRPIERAAVFYYFTVEPAANADLHVEFWRRQPVSMDVISRQNIGAMEERVQR